MQVNFLSPLPTNIEGSVPCFQIPRLGSENLSQYEMVNLCTYICGANITLVADI